MSDLVAERWQHHMALFNRALSISQSELCGYVVYSEYSHCPLTDEGSWKSHDLVIVIHVSLKVVKAPGNLVISAYVMGRDIIMIFTPGFKHKDEGVLLHFDLRKGNRRLGAFTLAHVSNKSIFLCYLEIKASEKTSMRIRGYDG
ncbi:hypothetical protein L1887_12480 [Cichorium endivia]|nr:hypothetical protein L1887_12480 [Cichorium endivia]